MWCIWLQSVVAVDRLSALHIGAAKDITGGELISSVSLKFPREWLGRLRSIKPYCIQKQRSVCLVCVLMASVAGAVLQVHSIGGRERPLYSAALLQVRHCCRRVEAHVLKNW